MANNFDSNTSKKVMRSFAALFQSERVLSKNVNTQLFAGEFTPQFGEEIFVKRPTDYKSVRTPDGDISGESKSDIIVGSAKAVAQDYITVFADWKEVDQALKMDQLDELLRPMAKRIVTDLETDFAKFMMRNVAGFSGDYGTAVTKWDHVAEAGAYLESTGVPMDKSWCYAVNPFTQRKLASDQRSLGGETGDMTANERATITKNFAGMDVKTASTLGRYLAAGNADRAGVLAANPVVTYLSVKDTMTQQIAVSGFGANLVIKAGEAITIAGRNRLNLSTREIIVDENGDQVLFSGVVTQDVTLDGTGAGTLIVTGPAVYEATGAYNTVDSAPIAGDVVTLGYQGATDKVIQPNLAWHPDAFTITSIPIEKLYSTDTIFTSEDGLQMRVSKGTDFDGNANKIRFDFHPAYGVLNPFFGVQSFGR